MIYLLEDDESIRKFVVYALMQSGFEAEGFELPSLFKAAVSKRVPDLVLLDIMLPEEDGLSVLKQLRNNPSTSSVPIIMLTAKSSEYDKVLGLDSGADDYLAKPFGTMELISRIKALLRRTSADKKDFTVGPLYLCPEKHLVTVNGKAVTLTLKEYNLLYLMISNRGIVFSRDHILEKIWGYDYDGESRTVDVHIKTLRSKLGEAGDLIQTIRGIGYKID